MLKATATQFSSSTVALLASLSFALFSLQISYNVVLVPIKHVS